MGESDWKPPFPQKNKKELLAIIFFREGMSTVDLKTGSHFRGQKSTHFSLQSIFKRKLGMKFAHSHTQIETREKNPNPCTYIKGFGSFIFYSAGKGVNKHAHTSTHDFNHPQADSSQSLLLLSEPHSLYF